VHHAAQDADGPKDILDRQIGREKHLANRANTSNRKVQNDAQKNTMEKAELV
jgi:hypothetical protein